MLHWTADPLTRGAYSYATLGTPQGLAVLKRGIARTVFFAGEALYEGPFSGTVEAALDSGRETARLMVKAAATAG